MLAVRSLRCSYVSPDGGRESMVGKICERIGFQQRNLDAAVD